MVFTVKYSGLPSGPEQREGQRLLGAGQALTLIGFFKPRLLGVVLTHPPQRIPQLFIIHHSFFIRAFVVPVIRYSSI